MIAGSLLNATRFFNSVLDPAALDQLAAAARPVSFRRGDKLMREGELGQSLFLIEGGKVSVSVHDMGGERAVATLGPGEVVGEMSLLTGARRSATVVASGKVTAFEVTKAALEPILAASPKLVEKFAAMMEQRFAELKRRHSDLARWHSGSASQAEIAARMTAFYSG